MKPFGYFLKILSATIRSHKKLSLVIAAIAVVIAVLAFSGGNQEPGYALATVSRKNMTQTVSVTGKVKAEREMALAFERSGTLVALPVRTGERVQKGALLAQLENSELRAQLAQAEATLAREKVKLSELQLGTRQEEIRIYETKLATAQTNLAETNTSVLTSLQSVYASTEDAIRNKINQVFDTPYSYYPTRIKFTSIYPDTERKLCNQKESIEYLLSGWKQSLQNLTSASDATALLTQTRGNLETLKTFADSMALLINAVANNDVNTSAQITSWRTDITNGRNAIISAMVSADTAAENLKSASLALQLAQDELDLKRAGSTSQQIQLQELQVQQAGASRDAIAAQLNKTILLAPMSGLVAKTESELGEIVALNTPLVHLISDNQYKIEVNVPEVEIAKLQTGNRARITLDAYGDSAVFGASVAAIDQSETVIEGVPTYTATLLFDKEDERIKSGMTANITITTAEKPDVLTLPQRAIQRKDNKKYVQVAVEKARFEEREITTGITDTTGSIEITGGLQEGERVLLP